MTIKAVRASLIRVSVRSQWILVEVETADGIVGLGEASLHFQAADCRDKVLEYGRGLEGLTTKAAFIQLAAWRDQDLLRMSARCSLDQALHDIEGQRRGLPISRLLSARPAEQLEVYANINRRTRDRSPAGFAASAKDAVAENFSALKIAPFDDLTPALDDAEAKPLFEAGVARIAAVREAIGPRRLLVDCHWRLSRDWIEPAVKACEALGVFWLETPHPEEPDWFEAIAAARKAANARGVLTAGCELKIGREGFQPYIDAGCYDVLMPDMKHCGGYGDFAAVTEAAREAGLQISPHNPTGPIAHGHSVHAAAAIDIFLILEMQFDETGAFREIVTGELPMPRDGMVTTPKGAGLGQRLVRERIDALLEPA